MRDPGPLGVRGNQDLCLLRECSCGAGIHHAVNLDREGSSMTAHAPISPQPGEQGLGLVGAVGEEAKKWVTVGAVQLDDNGLHQGCNCTTEPRCWEVASGMGGPCSGKSDTGWGEIRADLDPWMGHCFGRKTGRTGDLRGPGASEGSMAGPPLLILFWPREMGIHLS